jgi:alternate signal-mediated exported protein
MNANQSRFSRRTKGIIAGAAGVALLLGGSTFALWTASDDFAGTGKIVTGNMSVEATPNSFRVFDVSQDRDNLSDANSVVVGVPGEQLFMNDDNDPWSEIVPGDTIAASYEFDVKMKGDNLLGQLTASAEGATKAIPSLKIGYAVKIGEEWVKTTDSTNAVDGSWKVTDAETGAGEGILLHSPDALGSASVDLGLYANEAGEDYDNTKTDVTGVPSNGLKVTVVAYFTFPAEVGERNGDDPDQDMYTLRDPVDEEDEVDPDISANWVTPEQLFSSVTVSLNQVREGGYNFKTA